MFVYPESRAEFLELLARAHLLPTLNVGLSDEIDFWSYVNDLERVGASNCGTEDINTQDVTK